MASKDDSDIVRCIKCRTVLNESTSLIRSQRTPCPVCGSLSRDNMRVVAPKLSVSVPKWRARGKRQGKGEPFIDQYLKRELYRDTGEDHDVERTIDHERNIYREVIRDSKTGELIRDCYEPLDKHTGHGYAKHKGKGE
jgi:hypothetical protein